MSLTRSSVFGLRITLHAVTHKSSFARKANGCVLIFATAPLIAEPEPIAPIYFSLVAFVWILCRTYEMGAGGDTLPREGNSDDACPALSLSSRIGPTQHLTIMAALL